MGYETAIPWANVLVSLLIRFVGVFVVLAALQLGIYASGAIASRLAASKGGSNGGDKG